MTNLEKAAPDGANTRATTSSETLPVNTMAASNAHEQRDVEKAMAPLEPESRRPSVSSSDSSEADIDFEREPAQLDMGHQLDLHLTKSRGSLRTRNTEPLEPRLTRTTTGITRVLSRIATSKKEKLPPQTVPVSNLEKGVVGWESQDDPELPLNFPEGRKFLLLGLISIITLISPLASSMFAPGVTFMNKEFNNTSTILTSFSVSVFVLGYAIGPILLSPLSEIYGRRPVLTGANAFFVVWQIGCALAPNLGSLIVFRLLAGIGGSGCITIGGGVIADLFRPDQRGFASSIYSLGPLFGPVIGPICGGFIAQRAGWRWVFWVLLIAAGLISLFIECFNKETNHRVLIRRKVHRLRKELNRPELRSVYTKEGEAPKSPTAVLLQGMLRPLKMLCRSAITALMAIYMAVVYGLLYLLFTTISTVYMSQYGWQPEITGLAYLGIGIGFFLGVAVVAKISDKTVVRMTLANGGVFEPEMRLPACVFFACFVPISFFWYGWCAYKQVHWIVPIIGLMPFGFGMMGIFIPIQTYMIDAFPEYAASAIAALTIVRSLFGAFLPLAGPKMYATLNLGWGNSLLGFVALALIPVPLGIYKYGKYIRTNYPIKL